MTVTRNKYLYIKLIDFKILVALIFGILGVVIYKKIAPNIPNPDEGVVYYYQCRAFDERRFFTLESAKSLVKADQELFLLIPGYSESSFRNWLQVLSKELLNSKPSSCVIFVDHWNYLTFSRPFMTLNVKVIAQSIADLLKSLKIQSLHNIHIVGFSLGGWVAGLISNYLPKDKQIGRITAIDPSFPWIDTDNPEDFLDSDDAAVVVAIRTSKISQKIPPVKYDFSVNGATVQPECDVWWHPAFVQQICSHYKAPFLFASHLMEGEDSFPCCGCPNRTSVLSGDCHCHLRNSFGLNTLISLPGKFYMETSTNNSRS